MSERERPLSLRPILFPESAAVVGASTTPGKLGHTILSNMLDAGFRGPIHPIHPREHEILSRPAYPSLSEAPGPVDLVVVAIPGSGVVPVIEEAAEMGAGGAVVISAGFAEAGAEGAEAERRLRAISREAGLPIIGPNCQGVISRRGRLSAWFGPSPDHWGNGLFLSQSGGLAGTIIGQLNRARRGLVDTVVSLGNKSSVDEADLLASAAADEEIRFAMCYIEGFGDGRGRAFAEAAAAFGERGKPVVVLKGGRSGAGTRAASSHTASLAGSDRVFDAAMKQSGVLQAESIRAFLDIARFLAVQRPQPGRRVLILTNLGGPGVVTADLCEQHGLEVTSTTSSLQKALQEKIPSYCSVRNPIDLAGDPAPERYGAILREVYGSHEYDAVLIVAAPLSGDEQVARDIVAAHRETPTPTAVCWMGNAEATPAAEILESGKLPVYPMPEDAVRVLAAIVTRQSAKQVGE